MTTPRRRVSFPRAPTTALAAILAAGVPTFAREPALSDEQVRNALLQESVAAYQDGRHTGPGRL